jgi:hypothetical protein
MADKYKFIYGEQFAQKLPGSDQNFYFRTATEYKVDGNGKPIEGSARTLLYYAPKPAARTSDGKIWTPGTADSVDNFDSGGWVFAATTSDGGKTYSFRNYTQTDADKGRIPPGKNVGDEVLGATAQQSLSTSGGRFYEAVQNNLINLAATTQPGLAQVVSAKQTNAVQQQQTQQQQTQQQLDFSDINVEEIQSSIEDAEDTRRKEYGFYTYPINMDSNQDRILFTMKTIKGSNISPTFREKAIRRKYNEEIRGSVTLPIQPSITDSNTVDWSGLQLNALDAFIASASFNAASAPNLTGFAESIGRSVDEARKELLSVNGTQAMKLFLAQEAAGVQGLLSRVTGAIINPNLELLFNGPQLRSFSFTFRMSPRSEKEAKVVKNIIRFFKQGMSVKTTKSNVFLKSPNVFDIKYKTGNSDHPSINRIKTCALLGCDVDYTPDGTYMTFNDGPKTMTSYGMTLRFSELDPIYDRDYNEFSKEEIGF